jgi:predicted MPP superfamily phosphohydrolase
MSLRELGGRRPFAADRFEASGPIGSASAGSDPSERGAWLEHRRQMERGRSRATPDGPRGSGGLPRPILLAMGLGLRLVGLWRRGVANGLDVRRRRVAISLARLPPAFDGYRILHVADPHFDAAPGLAEAILRSIAGAAVDLCVLTGDFRAAERGPLTDGGILPALAALRAAVRSADGFVATLGNHDPGDIVPHLERLGYEVLLNRSRLIRRGAAQIAITGVDDVHRYYTSAAAAALAAHDPDRFGIALVHSPELAGEAAAAGYDLYLCGHTHGGQVCLPGGRPLITHLCRHRDLHSGLWRHRGMVGYTSRGAGSSGLPVRFNCPPEVTELQLRTGS